MDARRAVGILAAAVLGASLVLAPSSAQAEDDTTSTSAGVGTETLEINGVAKRLPLKRGGVDRAVAEAHGYEVRTTNSGVEYPVEKGSSVGIQNELPGDCGSSYVWFGVPNRTNHTVTIYTGWEINPGWPGAWDFDWQVVVVDNYGSSAKNWGGFLPSLHEWHGLNQFTSSGPGYVYAEVTVGLVILWNGTVCFSHGPWDNTNV